MMRRREWGPSCSHSRMTSVYNPGLQCAICGRSPQFGWLYRCTVDTEALILKAKSRGDDITFDHIGRAFVNQMSLGKYGADRRTRRYAFLRETTPSQLATYSPDQLITVLSQRDRVVGTINIERRRFQQGGLGDAGLKYPDNRKPWMPDEKQECSHTVCQSCHGVAKDKSWVSLNGVLNGDIPPTVATGYAFGYSKSRPYIYADVAANLGCRPVCFPSDHPVSLARRRVSEVWTLQDQINSWFSNHGQHPRTMEHGGDDSGDGSSDDDSITDSSDESFEDEEGPSVQWTHFPDPQLDEYHSDITSISETSFDQESKHLVSPPIGSVRPPWTPPPTPFHLLNEISGERTGQDGRSSSSLRTNLMVRTRLLSSLPSIGAVLGLESERECKPDVMGAVEYGSPLNDDVLEQACRVPLPRPDLAEEFLFAKGKISIGDFKHTEAFTKRHYHTVVPEVIHSPGDNMALALMTEESVEDGIPDLVLSVDDEEKTTK